MSSQYPSARAHRHTVDTHEDDGMYETRMPSSVRRYRPQAQARYAGTITQEEMVQRIHHRAHAETQTSLVPVRRAQPIKVRRSHWLLTLGVIFLVMIIGWVVLSLVTGWWQTWQDDQHFGRPRTFQTDAVVGHSDGVTPSHFIALNLNRRIEIIECPGGDCSKAKIYVGPVLIGQGQDLASVTLSFADVNGDHLPDMIVQVADSRLIYLNDHGQFRPRRPDEPVSL